MKNIKNYIGLFLLLWTISSCTDEYTLGDDSSGFRVIGNLDTSSRTEYEVGDDKVTVTWAADDAIGLFTDEQSSLLEYKATSSGKQVTFVPAGERLNQQEGKEVYAFYPYTKSDFVYPKVGLPGLVSQKYSDGLPEDYDLMYAKGNITGDELVFNFKHLLSFIKLNIKSEILKGTTGLYLRSVEPITYITAYTDTVFTPYYDFNEENFVSVKENYLWYNIPSGVITGQDIITCYIAVLPTSENNIISFYKQNVNDSVGIIFEKKVPEGGMKAGRIYDLTVNDIDVDYDTIEKEQREALIALYNATGGPQWRDNTNWCSDKPLKEWRGLNVSNGIVNDIMLTGNNLTGYIPDDIEKLRYLERLHLGYNNLSGTLPESISKLEHLSELELCFNSLEGAIPESYAVLMDRLELLDLGNNNFSGRLPEAIVSHPNWKNLWVRCINGGFDISGVKLPVADFVAKDIDGNIISSDIEFSKNKLTAIVHWSHDCPFSIDFIENHLIALYEMYKTKGFEVIGYSLDSEDEMRNYINEHQIKWRNLEISLLPGESQIPGLFTLATPTVFVIDQNKEVIFQDMTQDRNGLSNVLSEYLGDVDLYTSTDYSRDGEVQILQTATKGKGINLVFMGEAFVDKDMGDDGLYEQVMKKAMEQYFAYEPLKSFRDRFNVYCVKVVSPNAEFYPNAVHRINEDDALCFEYARKVPGLENAPYQMISVIYNKGCSGRSYTTMYLDGGTYVGYMMDGVNDVLNHEVCGHGLGRLMDEYVEGGYENQTLPDAGRIELDNMWNNYGWGANVDWRNSTEEVKWAHFLDDMRYAGESLGLYEGSYLYGKGAYRPTENSMMRYNDSPFNAPSRERLYQVIMKLSEGDSWVYDFEDFAAYDEINRNYSVSRALSAPSSQNVREDWEKRHRAPVVKRGGWKDAR